MSVTRTKVYTYRYNLYYRRILPSYLLLAYFTLFQERIKISSLQQSQAKEKEVLESKINHLESQNEAQNKLIRTLEDKDNMVGINVKNMEQELQLRQQVKNLIRLLELVFFEIIRISRYLDMNHMIL